MIKDGIAAINSLLDGLVTGDLSEKNVACELSLPESSAIDKLLILRNMISELTTYAITLSEGDVEAAPPPRQNYLAGGMKQLQSQLFHLKWQLECVANGDYGQRIDFMGDFSLVFNRMVAQLKDREEHIKAQRDIMMRVFDNIEPIIIVDAYNKLDLIYSNRMAEERFGVTMKQGFTLPLKTIIAHILNLPVASEERQIFDSESGLWYTVMSVTLPWLDHTAAVLYHFIDITAHKKRESRLELDANTDKLTKLFNRRVFERSFSEQWGFCLRSQKSMSIMIFDLDNFKNMNDTYGHLHGDNCLVAFADVLKKNISRSSDVIARYGGEEFAVLLPFTDAVNAARIAEKIRIATAELEIPVLDKPEEFTKITVSCGVASIIPDDGMTPKKLMADADLALYHSKQTGRNRVTIKTYTDL